MGTNAPVTPWGVIADKAENLAIQAGPKWGALCMGLGALAFGIMAVSHRSLDHAAFAIFCLGGAAGLYGQGVQSRKNAAAIQRSTDILVTGTAEVKDMVAGPGISAPPSADPALDRAQQKIEAGLSPTPTRTQP
jgi:hypothetical protein